MRAAAGDRLVQVGPLNAGAPGPCGNAHYLFAEDGHRPRHAKDYSELAADVASGAYPVSKHVVSTSDAEYGAFLTALDADT
jgi:hypothetical protein